MLLYGNCMWNLCYGEESRIVMQTKAAPDECVVGNRWKQVEVMKTLGSYVSNSGSCSACVEKIVEQMWKSYHANVGPGLLASSQCARFVSFKTPL